MLGDSVRDSVGKRILSTMWTELRLQSPRFNGMAEADQQEVLDRLRLSVEEVVNEAVTAIAASSFQKVAVTIDSVTFKDGVKVVLKGVATEAMSDVAAEVGEQAILVLCDSTQFTGDLGSVKPVPPQTDAFGGD